VRETGRFAKYASLAAALACFTVFALAAVGLHQERADHFGVEEQGPIPAALSHVLYGAPVGLVDSGLGAGVIFGAIVVLSLGCRAAILRFGRRWRLA
jgi:hypothetical protein